MYLRTYFDNVETYFMNKTYLAAKVLESSPLHYEMSIGISNEALFNINKSICTTTLIVKKRECEREIDREIEYIVHYLSLNYRFIYG